jgi:hypothetical protein
MFGLFFKGLDRIFSGLLEDKATTRPKKGEMLHLEGLIRYGFLALFPFDH